MTRTHAELRLRAEDGQVGGMLLLIFVLGLQLEMWSLCRQIAAAWEQAYQQLELRDQELTQDGPGLFEAWGQSWSRLPPRVDYGAYTQRDKDAEALCFLLRLHPFEITGADWRCA